jgi:hypothetical protein
VGNVPPSSLTREHLSTVLVNRCEHQVRQITKVQVEAHIYAAKCKIRRRKDDRNKAGIGNAGDTTAVIPASPPAAFANAFYQLSVPVCSRGAFKLEVYVGVPMKLIYLLFSQPDKFAARRRATSSAAVAAGAEKVQHSPADKALSSKQASPIPPKPSDLEEQKSSRGSGGDSSPEIALSSIELAEFPRSRSPDIENPNSSGGADSLHTSMLAAMKAEKNQYKSMFQEGEFVWKSNAFVMSAPPLPPPTEGKSHRKKSSRSRLTSSRSRSAAADEAATAAGFSHTVSVPIPVAVLQNVCHAILHGPVPLVSSGAASRLQYPIVIHVSKIAEEPDINDPAANNETRKADRALSPASASEGCSAGGKAASSPFLVSELTIVEMIRGGGILPTSPGRAATNGGATATAQQQTQQGSDNGASGAVAAGGGPTGDQEKQQAHSSPSSPPPAVVYQEDTVLSKLRFEKQLLVVTQPAVPLSLPADLLLKKPAVAAAAAVLPAAEPGHTVVYEMEELYGLHTATKLPSVQAAPQLVAEATEENKPRTPPADGLQVNADTQQNAAPGLSASDSNHECVICMSEIKDIILLPCRHVCICHICHENVTKW